MQLTDHTLFYFIFYSSIRYNVSLEGKTSLIKKKNLKFINYHYINHFDIIAPTAASQKIDEPPLTYLNKGKFFLFICCYFIIQVNFYYI